MKPHVLIGTLLLACSLTALPATPPAPPALRVEHAWIRWLPANLPCAGYATLVNTGDASVSLTGARSAAYGRVMLMQSRLADNDSNMLAVQHIDVPAHGSVKLMPGGYHIMLAHPQRPIHPGDTVPLTLQFADGATLQVDFSVLPANASGPAD